MAPSALSPRRASSGPAVQHTHPPTSRGRPDPRHGTARSGTLAAAVAAEAWVTVSTDSIIILFRCQWRKRLGMLGQRSKRCLRASSLYAAPAPMQGLCVRGQCWQRSDRWWCPLWLRAADSGTTAGWPQCGVRGRLAACWTKLTPKNISRSFLSIFHIDGGLSRVIFQTSPMQIIIIIRTSYR